MDKQTRKNNKMLLIQIEEELHAEIKKRAAIRYISIKKWVTRAIVDAIKNEQQYEK